MNELTPTQSSVITKLKEKPWQTAAALGASMTTMNSLERKDVVEGRIPEDCRIYHDPRSQLEWKTK